MDQLSFLDESGSVLRDLGRKQAVEHAEAEYPGWQELALGYVKEYACSHRRFMGEDVRVFAEERGLIEPPHKRSWGAVLLAAAKAGIVHRVGLGPVKNAKAHRAFASVWEVA